MEIKYQGGGGVEEGTRFDDESDIRAQIVHFYTSLY
jgi:hypothetical protein